MFGSGCQQTSRPTHCRRGAQNLDPQGDFCQPQGETPQHGEQRLPQIAEVVLYVLGPNLASQKLAPRAEAACLGATKALGLLLLSCGSEGSRDHQPLAFQETGCTLGGPRNQLWAFPQSPRKWVPAGPLAKLQMSPQGFSRSAPALLSAQADVGETRFSPWEGSPPSLSWQPGQPAWIFLPSFATPGLGWGKAPRR